MDTVQVIIPIYKANLSPLEKQSLKQIYEQLNCYPRVVIKPASLDLSQLQQEFPALEFVSFEDSFFQGISGYNRLMLSSSFYEYFLDKTTYLLIAQLDAYIFRDELAAWCAKGYDYIGAPWLQKPIYRMPVVQQIMQLSLSLDRLKGKPSKQQLYNKVGNGGLSLRKTESHYRIACQMKEQIAFYLSQKRHHLYNEDVFWATEPTDFQYPEVMEALQFADRKSVV